MNRSGHIPRFQQNQKHQKHQQPQQHHQHSQQPQELATWEQVVSFLEKNPFQEKTLSYTPPALSIEPRVQLSEKRGWVLEKVEPPTPLSCLLMCVSSEYASLTVDMRRIFLRDALTSLQEKATKHLKGRAWPAKKTYDSIVAISESEKASEWSILGLSAIAELYECQFIWFHDEKKTAQFIPENPRMWKADRPVYFLRTDARAILESPDDWTQKNLGEWIKEKEGAGWDIAWHVAPLEKLTLVELKEMAEKDGIQLPQKATKAVCAHTLAIGQTIALFNSWK